MLFINALLKLTHLLKSSALVASGILLISGGTAHAQRVSGGGNVVHCLSDVNKSTYTLLDYYDAIKLNGYGFKLDLGPGNTADEKIEHVLKRLEKVDPFRAEMYRKLANKFESESLDSHVDGWATPSNDLGSGYILPVGCIIQRAVMLRSDDELMLLKDNRPYERSRLWKEFDETTKAGMKLHEIAYREAIERGATDSLSIRRYVALISSKNVLTVDYSIEILMAGLSAWGTAIDSNVIYSNSYYPQAQKDVDSMSPFSSYSDNSAYFNKDGNGGVNGAHFSSATKDIQVTFEGQKLKCEKVWVNSDFSNLKKQEYINVYEKLRSPRGLFIKDLNFAMKVMLDKCGSIRFTSEMFQGSTLNFDLFSTERPLWYDGSFSKSKLAINVGKGHIDGVDVSGKLCEITIIKPKGADLPTVKCEEKKDKAW